MNVDWRVRKSLTLPTRSGGREAFAVPTPIAGVVLVPDVVMHRGRCVNMENVYCITHEASGFAVARGVFRAELGELLDEIASLEIDWTQPEDALRVAVVRAGKVDAIKAIRSKCGYGDVLDLDALHDLGSGAAREVQS